MQAVTEEYTDLYFTAQERAQAPPLRNLKSKIKATCLRKRDVEDSTLAGLRGFEVDRDLVPVNDVPEGVDVLRAPVLVLEVVGVLPYIEAEDGDARLLNVTSHERIFLVSGARDEELAIVAHAEPGPAGAKPGGGGAVKRLLHFVERAKVGVDLRLQVAHRARVAGSWRRHDCPKERVVVVAATGVDDWRLDLRRDGGHSALHRLERHALQRAAVGARQDVVNVGLVHIVVLRVVDSHGLSVDIGVEGGVLVGQDGQIEERHFGDGFGIKLRDGRRSRFVTVDRTGW